jgi:hypothetical protein
MESMLRLLFDAECLEGQDRGGEMYSDGLEAVLEVLW